MTSPANKKSLRLESCEKSSLRWRKPAQAVNSRFGKGTGEADNAGCTARQDSKSAGSSARVATAARAKKGQLRLCTTLCKTVKLHKPQVFEQGSFVWFLLDLLRTMNKAILASKCAGKACCLLKLEPRLGNRNLLPRAHKTCDSPLRCRFTVISDVKYARWPSNEDFHPYSMQLGSAPGTQRSWLKALV